MTPVSFLEVEVPLFKFKLTVLPLLTLEKIHLLEWEFYYDLYIWNSNAVLAIHDFWIWYLIEIHSILGMFRVGSHFSTGYWNLLVTE